MDYYKVKNFEKFQHYGDSRAPIWIKLYNNLLDDYSFSCLPDASKAHLMLIWLLASRHGNRIPADPAWIGRKIGATSVVDFDTLVSSGFIERCTDNEYPASKSLAMGREVLLEQSRVDKRRNTLSACADAGDRTEEESAPVATAAINLVAIERSAKTTRTRKPAADAKPEHGAVKTYFFERWKDLRSSGDAVDYPWKPGRDDKHLKWILDQVARSPAKAKAIIEAFMRDDDPWLADKGHDISYLVSRFPKYLARRSSPPEASDNGFVRAELTDEILRYAVGEGGNP